jgi:hypothetical protein
MFTRIISKLPKLRPKVVRVTSMLPNDVGISSRIHKHAYIPKNQNIRSSLLEVSKYKYIDFKKSLNEKSKEEFLDTENKHPEELDEYRERLMQIYAKVDGEYIPSEKLDKDIALKLGEELRIYVKVDGEYIPILEIQDKEIYLSVSYLCLYCIYSLLRPKR